jgi:hypothetical protein
MKNTSIRPEFVDLIPNHLEEGVLYICERYKTAIHKCCCGCGEEVVTPLSPVDWSIEIGENGVSLSPSIGNWSFACKSHYHIRSNKVIWAARFSQWQIDQVRARDKAHKKAYIEAVNQQKSLRSRLIALISNIWRAIISWFN